MEIFTSIAFAAQFYLDLLKEKTPVLRLHSTPSMAHRWPIDGHRNFFRWPSMGFELWPSAWGQLWSIFGLNISNFNLFSFPFEPEQAFSSLKIIYIGTLSLNCLKKMKNVANLQLFALKCDGIELQLLRKPSACKKKNDLKYAEI